MITNYPVIISARDQAWANGLGKLYEPFEEDETYDVYSVLHIAARTNVPHGKIGYYLLTSLTVQEARQHGLILTDADGDQYGFAYPQAGPASSLGEAIRGIQPAPPPVGGIAYPAPFTPEDAPLTLDELLERKARTKRPLRYCLIGSTDKAQHAFADECLRLTLADQIVLTIGANAKDCDLGISREQKDRLDVLHLFKIDEADIVRVLNVGSYIGTSTRRELEYARRLGKPIEFLEDPGPPEQAEEINVTAR
jgi:hypothetical protein